MSKAFSLAEAAVFRFRILQSMEAVFFQIVLSLMEAERLHLAIKSILQLSSLHASHYVQALKRI